MERPRRAIQKPQHFEDYELISKKAKKRKPNRDEPRVDGPQENAGPVPLEEVGRLFSKDWGEYNNEFWSKKFFTPTDDITLAYMEVTQKLGDILPANFQLFSDIPEAFGVANLELKQELKKPIKHMPLFSNLRTGHYELPTTKSDKNISSSINFFRNNLPSFVQYKDKDEIDWVIEHHRRLIVEILEFYAKKKEIERKNPSIATIKSRFNAITRIFRIAYETKAYELYTKCSSLVMFLGRHHEDNEFNNELNEIEARKYVSFEVVLQKQNELQKSFESRLNKFNTMSYDFHQDMLLVSLYSLIPPLRNEIKTLQFTNEVQKEGNWIVFKNNTVLMDLNEEKKKHDAILFNLSEDAPILAHILQQSWLIYPRQFVFTPYRKYPDMTKQASEKSVSDRITKIFLYTGKAVSVNALRSSYVTYMNTEAIKKGKPLTVKDKEKIATRMRTSRKYLDEAYLKIFPIPIPAIKIKREPLAPIVEEEVEEAPPNNEEPEPELTNYEKQLDRNKKYYHAHKEEIIKKKKEYRAAQPLFDKNRKRILNYLNNDPLYYDKMKPETKEKYNFQLQNGRWV